jgi:hypothetical protein
VAIKLPRPQRVNRQDLGPNAPSWLDGLLGVLNAFMAQALQSLTDLANQDRTRVLEVTTGSSVGVGVAPFPLLFRNELPQAPVEVRLAQVFPLTASPASMASAAALTSWDVSGENVRIWFITGLSPSTRYRVTVAYR